MACAALVCLAVEEKVSEDARRAPEETVRPALDAALVLVKDKDGAGCDHFSLRVDETAGHSWYESATGSLEDEEGIAGGLNPARPGRFCPS